MGKLLLTIMIIFLAVFIIFSKDISKGLKGFLIVCLVIAEILIIKILT